MLFTSYAYPSSLGSALRTTPVRLSDYINVLDFGAKNDGNTDDTQAIQQAIYAAAREQKQGVYCPGGPGYVINKQGGPNGLVGLALDIENNMFPTSGADWNSLTTYSLLQIVVYAGLQWRSLANNNVGNIPSFSSVKWQNWIPNFSYSLSLVGDTGFTNANRFGTTFIAGSYDFCVLMLGPQQGGMVSGVQIIGSDSLTAATYRGGNSPNFIGIGQANNGAGSRTLIERCMINGFYDGVKTAANGFDGLGDSLTVSQCEIAGCFRGLYISATQNFINTAHECTFADNTNHVVSLQNGGCRVEGGNYSTSNAQQNVFALTGVTASVASNVISVTATVTAPDDFLNQGNIYNAFAMVTAHFGVVPLSLVSFNSGTKVGVWNVLNSWGNGTYANTMSGEVLTDLDAVSKIYACEMCTAFTGHGIDVNHIHVENPSVATRLFLAESGFGNRLNSMANVYINYDPSQGFFFTNSYPDAQLACFYVQQEWPFIQVTGANLEVNNFDCQGSTDFLMVEVTGTASTLTWRGARCPPINMRGAIPNVNKPFTADYTDAQTDAFGFGLFEVNPWVPLFNGNTMQGQADATLYRTTGLQGSPCLGFRPAPWTTPALAPSQLTTVSGVLPAITFNVGLNRYDVPYPILCGNIIYRLFDWNLGVQAKYYFISDHIGYSYGQDLTTSEISGLTWSGQSGCPTVYINDTRLLFPGLTIQLTANAVTEPLLIREVHQLLGYVRCFSENQDGSPYFPAWGSVDGTAQTGNTLKQPVYSITTF